MHALKEQDQTAAPTRRRFGVMPAVELLVLAIAVATLVITYRILSGASGEMLDPAPAALLLLANLAPGVIMIVLLGRRIVRLRAARSGIPGGGEMHTRLVVTFSLIASVPIVLTVIAASFMFQTGVQYWGSERAQRAFNTAIDLAKRGQREVTEGWAVNTQLMAQDLIGEFPDMPSNSADLKLAFLRQAYVRSFSQAVLFEVPDGGAKVNLLYAYETPTQTDFTNRLVESYELLKDGKTAVNFNEKLVWVFTPVDPSRNLYLYIATTLNAPFLSTQAGAASRLIADYSDVQRRARALQIRFNAVLYGVALLIVGLTMWIAILVADRLVRPVNELVGAARRIAEGDLGVRVPEPKNADEIGTLGIAFNTMTERLQEQTNELVTANAESESRRALIEAVMSGVTAGVVSVDADRRVRVINQSAMQLLRTGEGDPVGAPLAQVAPDLAPLLDGDAREAVVQVTTGGDARTLAVKITSDEDGQVLTFDDITQQLLDQRRAAWSDVARRIAHEIKNPLTPIQLAAERLQRRYGKQVDLDGEGVFQRLTETIVRQVGDLRRMVDEFSSFARMPKPVFRRESLLDMARQALFLHEVAHPAVQFTLDAPDPAPSLVCDRRQIGQALTNVVKNAVEAIEARGEGEALPRGEIVLTISRPDDQWLRLTVADNGIGLPIERDRIVEPYMTTRSRGTGLGLAIVKKIVEEHCGTIGFSDRPGGGTLVTISFDTALLDNLTAIEPAGAEPAEDTRPPALTRTGNTKP